MIKIVVEDSGPGIPGNIKDRIFEPMFTSKDIGKGTGIGLSISHDIAKNHGGILVLDHGSANTRFVLMLPKKNNDTNQNSTRIFKQEDTG